MNNEAIVIEADYTELDHDSIIRNKDLYISALREEFENAAINYRFTNVDKDQKLTDDINNSISNGFIFDIKNHHTNAIHSEWFTSDKYMSGYDINTCLVVRDICAKCTGIESAIFKSCRNIEFTNIPYINCEMFGNLSMSADNIVEEFTILGSGQILYQCYPNSKTFDFNYVLYGNVQVQVRCKSKVTLRYDVFLFPRNLYNRDVVFSLPDGKKCLVENHKYTVI
jgi:hypothetical protein